jgi:predicted  nucleic acid-binding Zn-ribbon protein
MKTIQQLNDDIQQITTKIANEYPELTKFITEIPSKNEENMNETITIQDLKNYYSSLESLLKNYSKDHLENN